MFLLLGKVQDSLLTIKSLIHSVVDTDVKIIAEVQEYFEFLKNDPAQLKGVIYISEKFYSDLSPIYEESKLRDTPFIMIGDTKEEVLRSHPSFFEDNPMNSIIENSSEIETLERRISLIYSKKNNILKFNKTNASTLKQISIVDLLVIPKLPCDVYIKLRNEKFIKIYTIESVLNLEDVSKFLERGVNYLHIDESEFKHFQNLKITRDDINIQEVRLMTLKNTVKQIGLDEDIIDHVEEVMADIVHSFSKDKDIFRSLKIFEHSLNYTSEHSLLLSYLNISVMRNWKMFDKNMESKIIKASLFHDFSIEDSLTAMLHDLYPNQMTDKSFHHDHSMKTHEIFQNSTLIPSDVLSILKTHHMFDIKRIASADVLNSLPLVNAIFCMNHNFLNELYRRQFRRNEVADILNELKRNAGEIENLKKAFDLLSLYFEDKRMLDCA